METIEQHRNELMQSMRNALELLKSDRDRLDKEIKQYDEILSIISSGTVTAPVEPAAPVAVTASKKVPSKKKRAVRKKLAQKPEHKTFMRGGREIRFFSEDEKRKILAHAKQHGVRSAVEKSGAHESTIYGWAKQAEARTRASRAKKTKKSRRGKRAAKTGAPSASAQLKRHAHYSQELKFRLVALMLGFGVSGVALSATAVAEQTGIAQSTLSRWLHEYGDEVRELFGEQDDEAQEETGEASALEEPPHEEVRVEVKHPAQQVAEAKRAWGWDTPPDQN